VVPIVTMSESRAQGVLRVVRGLGLWVVTCCRPGCDQGEHFAPVSCRSPVAPQPESTHTHPTRKDRGDSLVAYRP